MTAQIRSVVLIVLLWLAACAAIVASALAMGGSLASHFGAIALTIIAVTTTFISTLNAAPHLSRRPVVVAFYTAVFVFALAALGYLWFILFIASIRP